MISSSLKILTILLGAFGINNMPLYHALSINELIFIFLFYNSLLDENGKVHFRFWLLPLLLFNIIDTLLIESIYTFNSIGWSVNTSIFIILGLFYYYRLYERAEEVAIERYPNFYINAGLLIYTSGSLFTYLLAWKIFSKPAHNFFHSGWLIQSAVNIIKNGIITYGLCLIKRS